MTLSGLLGLAGAARGLPVGPPFTSRSALEGRRGSRLRGRGLDFIELRAYQPGDDVRTIDWRASARSGETQVRVYQQERDRPVLLVVDQRIDMFFGSQLNMKSVTAAEVAALLALRFLQQGDRVGGIVLSDSGVTRLAPQRSRAALRRFLSDLTDANRALDPSTRVPEGGPTLDDALAEVERLAHHDVTVILLSDFAAADAALAKRLERLGRHNDVILGLVYDPMAQDLPPGARVTATDGRLRLNIDTGLQADRAAVEAATRRRLDAVLAWPEEIGVPVLPLSAAEPSAAQLSRLLGGG
ncbi:DUF58 domain-containing protein [Oceanomicrobium pacificus]|uniref:DUF58 domain-containing protein n=1 Tax=Oceanomicrobium pacificus TaxID=2692916 RepID=UPI002E2E18BC|nr:DUF58 domain-containing protein [Oceanomicrobium pacificus]